MDFIFSIEQVTLNEPVPGADPRTAAARWVPRHNISWFAIVGLLFLAVNSTATICRSIHDPETVAFVVFSNVDIILLYWCMSQFEIASAKRKEALKGSVWILATLLTALFSHRVAGMMPPAIDKIVWGLAAVSICGSFYALFVYKETGSTIASKV